MITLNSPSACVESSAWRSMTSPISRTASCSSQVMLRLLGQPALVQRVAPDNMLPQRVRRPDSELGAPAGVHSVAHSNDHIQVVVLRLVCLAVGGSMCKFCTYSTAVKLPRGEDVPDVLRDDAAFRLEQLTQLRLCQPHRVALQAHVQGRGPVLGLVDDDLAFPLLCRFWHLTRSSLGLLSKGC